MKMKTKKITVDRYLDFFHSRPRTDLTVSELNQIVVLHRFKRLKNKKAATEALEELDLIDLSRSTIDSSTEVPSSASIVLEELVDDLKTLDWQECCIISLLSLYSDKGGMASTSTLQVTDLSSAKPADSLPLSESQSVPKLKKKKPVPVSSVYSPKGDVASTSTLHVTDLSSVQPADSLQLSESQSASEFKKRKAASVSKHHDVNPTTNAATDHSSTEPAERKEQPATDRSSTEPAKRQKQSAATDHSSTEPAKRKKQSAAAQKIRSSEGPGGSNDDALHLPPKSLPQCL